MPYVPARYMPPDPFSPPDPPELAKPVEAIDEHGQTYSLREDSQEGQWLDYIANGGTIGPMVIPPVSGEQVDRERDRRITGGFDYMGHRFQSDEFSQRNIADASQSADAAIARGVETNDYRWQVDATEDFAWIDANNSLVLMTAFDVQGLGLTMLRWKQAMIFNGRALKDTDPIPLDYTDDAYWSFVPPSTT